MLGKTEWVNEKTQANALNRPPEPATIGDEMCQRIINVDNHLLILIERLSLLADRLVGPDETAETANGELADQLYPPLIERLSSGIFLLERRAKRLQETIDRFSGLV